MREEKVWRKHIVSFWG